MRGIGLLKVGGRMVYSTCSMNPVENEAVVAELLMRSGNSVELLDVSMELPELVRRPGLSTWKVQDRGSWLQTFEDVHHDRKNVILSSMFPTSKITHESHTVCSDIEFNADNADSNFPLHRCMRIVPHDQDSGAFFIAVLHKLSPLNESQMLEVTKTENPLLTDRTMNLQEEVHPGKTLSENISMKHNCTPSKVIEDNNQTPTNNSLIDVEMVSDIEIEYSQAESGDTMKLQNQYKWRGVDPVLFFKDETVIKSIVSFFGVEESFPLEGHLVTRSDNARRLYYVSKSVKEILELNVKVGWQIKIASLGLKMFERHRSKDGCSCPYRLSYEGLPLLLPYISKRILYASLLDFQHLLQYRTINFAHFSDARFGEEVVSLMPGCCVVVLRQGHQNVDPIAMDTSRSTVAIVCWRGKATMNVLVSPLDRRELLERITYCSGLKAIDVKGEKSNLHQGS